LLLFFLGKKLFKVVLEFSFGDDYLYLAFLEFFFLEVAIGLVDLRLFGKGNVSI
jgi:hypothetical protein